MRRSGLALPVSLAVHLALWAAIGARDEAGAPDAELELIGLALVSTPRPAPRPAPPPPAPEPPTEARPTAAPVDGAQGPGRVRRGAARRPVAAVVSAAAPEGADAFLDALMARHPATHPASGAPDGGDARGEAGPAASPRARAGPGAAAAVPEAVRCADPIAGTWRARRFDEERGGWTVVTLNVQREAERLFGAIRLHVWSGGRGDTTPGPCDGGATEHRVTLDGRGGFLGARVWLEGDNAREVSTCDDSAPPVQVSGLSGSLDGAALRARATDGRWFRFRRVECAGEADAARVRSAMSEARRP